MQPKQTDLDRAIEERLKARWPKAPSQQARQDQRSLLRGAALVSVAASLPQKVVTNEQIAPRLGVTNDWIVERTGVRERRFAVPGETLAGFAAEAGSRALEAAGLDPASLDQVLVATMTHDELTPNAASLVAEMIGADKPGATDLGVACTGFVAAIAAAAAMIEARRADNVLVIGADLMSRITDPDDRATAAILADGAGAVLMGAVEGSSRVGPVVLGSDGASGWVLRASRQEALIRMEGPETFIHAIDRLTEATSEALERAEASRDDIDLFVFHQANSRIIAAVGDRLALPRERVIDCVPMFGNTSAGSIPVALAEAQQRGLLVEGSRVLLAAFGGGLTWGATVVEWGRGASNGSRLG